MIDDEESAIAWLQNLPEWDELAQARLDKFVGLLAQENSRQNLVAASSLAHLWQRHVADSAQLLLHVPRGTCGPWLDLGTGAGFPGVVIAILRPELDLWLVESRPRRVAWLAHVIAALDLTRVKIAPSRLELLETKAVSVISARAFAPLDRLLRLSARFSTVDTLWLLPKGRSAAHELQELSGWQHMFHVEQSLTDQTAGLIVGRLNSK
ncbi:MAG: 16S rRNA (guanine(527)-N(7))-methyltransferase RsmG [Pseudomonadota bacterium]|nr:16S rRNA (guanine(527)-N(7))-methyltransferase RsmG [Pseudomonadota bacterium]